MPWGDLLSGRAFGAWFAAAGAGGRFVLPYRRLWFHISSMRDLDDVPPELAALADGQPLPRQDQGQRLGDLRAWSLVQIGSSALTPLGQAVHEQWQRFQIGGGADEELARELIVVLEAKRLRVQRYLDAMDFWQELSQKFGVTDLLQNWTKLFLLPVLSAEHDGFSPLRALVANNVGLADLNAADFPALAESVAPGIAAAREGARIAAARVASENPRMRHVATFCLALTIATMRDDAEVRQIVTQFGAPRRADEWAALPAPELERVLHIFRSSRPIDGIGEAMSVLRLLERRKNVILFGPPGTGKTRAGLAVADQWRADHGDQSVFEVTFHPSYGYEDFVWGIRPRADDGRFQGNPGVLIRACESAQVRPTLLLIDEINRADTARVFGELITYIEPDKRDRLFRIAQDPENPRQIPAQLHVLGTMNTADRSVSLLDTALRRRFAFVEFRPNPEAFGAVWLAEVGGISLRDLLSVLNARLERIGIEPDRAIGHALLAIPLQEADPEAALFDRFEHDIHPLIVDFCFSDRQRIQQVLGACVDPQGRFAARTPTNLIEALRQLVAQPQ